MLKKILFIKVWEDLADSEDWEDLVEDSEGLVEDSADLVEDSADLVRCFRKLKYLLFFWCLMGTLRLQVVVVLVAVSAEAALVAEAALAAEEASAAEEDSAVVEVVSEWVAEAEVKCLPLACSTERPNSFPDLFSLP